MGMPTHLIVYLYGASNDFVSYCAPSGRHNIFIRFKWVRQHTLCFHFFNRHRDTFALT